MLPPAYPRGVFPPVPLSPCWLCILPATERQLVPALHAGEPARDKVRGRFGEKEEVREREAGSDHTVFTAQNNKVRIPEGGICCFGPALRILFHCFRERPQSSAMYPSLLGTLLSGLSDLPLPFLPLNSPPARSSSLAHSLAPLPFPIFLRHVLS